MPGDDPMALPRVTLVGTLVPVADEELPVLRARFLAEHPSAESYVEFRDFGWWRIELDSVRFVGGYGRMSWVDIDAYTHVQPDPLARHGDAIMAHMNTDHADANLAYARALAGIANATSARMVAVDRLGFDLLASTPDGLQPARVNFDEPVDTPDAVRKSVIVLLARARELAGRDRSVTPTGFVALRKAVALAHATRGVRLRITHRGTYLAEVGHDVVVRTSGSPLRFTPCQLRVALGRALVDSIAGRSVSAFGLPIGHDPEIHYGVVGGTAGAVLPFGIVRRVDQRSSCFDFTTTVPVDDITALCRRTNYAQHPCLSGEVDLRLAFDEAVAVTTVTLRGPTDDTRVLENLAYEMLLGCATEELVDPAWATTPLT